jgi:hypothetical protein
MMESIIESESRPILKTPNSVEVWGGSGVNPRPRGLVSYRNGRLSSKPALSIKTQSISSKQKVNTAPTGQSPPLVNHQGGSHCSSRVTPSMASAPPGKQPAESPRRTADAARVVFPFGQKGKSPGAAGTMISPPSAGQGESPRPRGSTATGISPRPAKPQGESPRTVKRVQESPSRQPPAKRAAPDLS